MNERPSAPVHNRAGVALLAATSLAGGAFGWFFMWARYPNIDESYLLVSLREWFVRGHLYDRVFSQYGPFYYLVFGLPERLLGTQWTLAAGRVTNLALWVGVTFLVGLVVQRLTLRIAFAVAAEVVVFCLLKVLVYEPMHPGAVLCALLASTLVTVTVVRPRAPRAADFLTGALVTAVALTKINIGIFMVVAFAFAAVASFPPSRRASVFRTMIDILIVAIGPVLLLSDRSPITFPIPEHQLFGISDLKLLYVAIYVAAALYLVAASRLPRDDSEEPTRIRFAWVLWGIASVASATTLFCLTTGTTTSALFESVILRPLRQSSVLQRPVHFSYFVLGWLLLAPLLVVALRRFDRGAGLRVSASISGIGRIVAGLALTVSVFGSDFWSSDFYRADGGRFAMLPVAAFTLVPLVSRRPLPGGSFARRFLAALAVTQSLHAYPVPGSQVAYSVWLAAICGVVIVSDGITELLDAAVLGHMLRQIAPALGALTIVAVPLVLPFGVNAPIAYPGEQFAGWFADNRRAVPVSLPGSGPLRLGAHDARAVRSLVQTLRQRCDTYVTVQGNLNAFYVLSGLHPPTGYNPSVLSLLTSREQATVVRALRTSNARRCLLLGGGRLRSTLVNGQLRMPYYGFSRPSRLERYLYATHWTEEPVPGLQGSALEQFQLFRLTE
jgi:hypothetical protein